MNAVDEILSLEALEKYSGDEALNLLITIKSNYLPELGSWTVINKASLNNFRHQTSFVMEVVKFKWFKKGSVHQRKVWLCARLKYKSQVVAFVFNWEILFDKHIYINDKFILDKANYLQCINYLHNFIEKEQIGNTEPIYEEFLYKGFGAGVLEEQSTLAINNKYFSLTDLEEIIKLIL